MLGLGGKRQWPIFPKTAIPQRLKNRLEVATNGHCSDKLSNATICVQKSGLPAWGTAVSLFA